MCIGNVVELCPKPPLIVKNVRQFCSRTEIKRKSKVFTMAGIIQTRCKTWRKYDFSSNENIKCNTATYKETLVCCNAKGRQRPDVMAVHFPAIFHLDKCSRMIAVYIED